MRETGPTAKNLDDPRAASPYVGAARTLLGTLKNDMGFNALALGKLVRELPDGTRITVESRFGQDKISIETAATTSEVGQSKPGEAVIVPPDVPQTEPLTYEMSTEMFRIAGYCDQYEPESVRRAAYWDGPGSVIDLGFLPKGTSARAYGISDDGQAVVGSCQVTVDDTFADERAFVWRRKTGMLSLGTPPRAPGGLHSTKAYDCSRDGLKIVGEMSDAVTATAAFVWDAITGYTRLPAAYAAAATGISANGQFIIGSIDTPESITRDACVWTRGDAGWELHVIPRPGTRSPTPIADPAGYDLVNLSDDDWVAVDVDNVGLVTVRSTHITLHQYGASTTFYDQGAGVPVPFVSGVEGPVDVRWSAVPASNFRTYNYGTSARSFSADNVSTAIAHADDGGYAVVGTEARNVYGLIEQWFDLGAPNNLSRVRIYNAVLGSHDWGWFWNQRRGQVFLGVDTLVLNVDESARIIVGKRFTTDDIPVYWVNGSLTAHDLPMIPGTAAGRAVAVSAPIPLVNSAV